MKFIHFGSPCFDRGRFVPVRNIPYRNKPDGGLWAMDMYGWDCDSILVLNPDVIEEVGRS